MKSTHDPAPWTDTLMRLVCPGDDLTIPVPCRVLAEENFQFAKSRVNAHDDLVAALKKMKEFYSALADHKPKIKVPGVLWVRGAAAISMADNALAKVEGKQS